MTAVSDPQIILVSLILFSLLALLVRQTISVDKTSLCVMVALAIGGILPPWRQWMDLPHPLTFLVYGPGGHRFSD